MPDTKPETARVDPAATRRRLASFLGGEGYRPELLRRVARLSLELGEQAQAGRYWLLSDATGAEVDAAVEKFAETCQRLPRLMASELPRFVRDFDVEAYAPAAKARIEKYGLREHLAGRAPKQAARKRGFTGVALGGLALMLLLAAILLLLRR